MHGEQGHALARELMGVGEIRTDQIEGSSAVWRAMEAGAAIEREPDDEQNIADGIASYRQRHGLASGETEEM
jgi:hypothetical protein